VKQTCNAKELKSKRISKVGNPFGEEHEQYLTVQNCTRVLSLQKEAIATTKSRNLTKRLSTGSLKTLISDLSNGYVKAVVFIGFKANQDPGNQH
jgi:hypothetical protein